MKLRELDYALEIGDLLRNNLFLTPDEVTALSLQFSTPYSVEPSHSTGTPRMFGLLSGDLLCFPTLYMYAVTIMYCSLVLL